LKRIIHGAGNAIRYEIDYSDWLEDGTSLTAGTVTMDAASIGIVDVTIGTVTLTPSHRLVFLLSGGSLNETFILDVQATDSRGEIKNDTLSFSIQAP
jgi:hypothetical protein